MLHSRPKEQKKAKMLPREQRKKSEQPPSHRYEGECPLAMREWRNDVLLVRMDGVCVLVGVRYTRA